MKTYQKRELIPFLMSQMHWYMFSIRQKHFNDAESMMFLFFLLCLKNYLCNFRSNFAKPRIYHIRTCIFAGTYQPKVWLNKRLESSVLLWKLRIYLPCLFYYKTSLICLICRWDWLLLVCLIPAGWLLVFQSWSLTYFICLGPGMKDPPLWQMRVVLMLYMRFIREER